MSDFDKEAERERLREKYENDKEEREATERMSELLLQGATMTNAHCSDCGDPIFRYDGQEFCATCERPVDRDGGNQTEQAADTGTDGQDDAASVEVTSPRQDSRVVFGGEQGDDPEINEKETQATPADATDNGQRRQVDTEPAADSTDRRDDRQRRGATAQGTGQHGGDTSGVAAARASLVQTLAAFSRRAAATEDPQRAREHLQTAREAAETLAALRQ